MRIPVIIILSLLVAGHAQAQNGSDRELLRYIVEDHYAYRNFQMKPAFPGDRFALENYIQEVFRNPFPAIPDTVYYYAVARFEIDYFGIPVNVRIEDSFSTWEDEVGCLDEEVYRILYGMPLWYPGENNGAPAKMQFVQPIAVTLYPAVCSSY